MKKKIIIAVAVIVILAAGGTFYLNHKVSSAVKDGKIIKGVSCEGISIGGMTRSESKRCDRISYEGDSSGKDHTLCRR